MSENLVKLLPFPTDQLRLYNTKTREIEAFKPMDGKKVTMYTCGPTVYNFAHIGNFRTYVFEDILRRTLKFFGFQVVQAMNITDVDDKTIKGAIENKVSLETFVQPYKTAFFADLLSLGIERVEFYPCATEYIAHMIDFILKLMDKKIAYKSPDGSVYFSIDKCPHYGCLSHLDFSQLKVGARDTANANDEYEKDNIGDFALWKAYDPKRDGEIFWESPFGRGRPGWHLECSTMAMHLLGETIDIHVGAVDNIFPHHENEIAQSECLTDKLFVRHWLHSEHLIVGGKKMSKSLGNFYTLRDLLKKGYSGLEVRYMLMQTHYRTQLNFTLEGMEGARHALARLQDFVIRMQELANGAAGARGLARDILRQAIDSFTHALAQDLNISVGLSALFDMIREMNALADKNELLSQDAQEVLYVLQEFNRVLGVMSFESLKAPAELELLLEQRQKARKEKNWALSDQIRDQIHDAGYIIEDTPTGARLKKK